MGIDPSRKFVMKFLALLTVVLLASCDANANPEPAVVEIVGGTKQKIAELRIRNTGHCHIYKIVVDDNTYIVNTCGGIVLAPKADQ